MTPLGHTGRVGRLVIEIVVIMAGVLVALVADEWRRGVSDRRVALEYEQRLVVDLQEDLDTWTRTREAGLQKDSLLSAVESWVAAPDHAEHALRGLAANLVGANIFSASFPSPRRATFDELVTSGRLGLLSDPELRSELAFHYRSAEDEAERLANLTTGYQNLVIEALPVLPRGLHSIEARPTITGDVLLGVGESTSRPDVRGVLMAERHRATVLVFIGERLTDRTQYLLDLLAR